jgi:hypothetical protein
MNLFRLAPTLLATTIAAYVAPAQQPNVLAAALSVNGTGEVDPATGLVRPTSSQIAPPPPGGAPLYRHRTQAGAALELRVQAAPGAPVILVAGTPQPPQNVGAGFLEIAIPSMVVLVDGATPFANLLNATAFVAPTGAWTLTLGSGLPPGAPDVHLQAAVLDPTAPFGVRLTGSITTETRNDVDTLARNVLDAFNSAPTRPLYGASLEGPNFSLNGMSRQALFSQGGQEFTSLLSTFPNATNAPPLPTVGPTPGQTTLFGFEIETELSPPCPGLVATERNREYDLIAAEWGGVWKFAGNGRDAEISATLMHMAPGPDVFVRFEVFDETSARGGVASVTVSGPQLAGVNLGTMTATSSAAGSFTLAASSPDEWFASIRLAAFGTSRLPLIEDAIGPRDVYSISILWNDASTSGPYLVPLRAAVDVDLSPASAAATAPGAGSPFGVLTGAGGLGANLSLTFAAGGPPNPSDWTSFSVFLNQQPTGPSIGFDRLLVPTAPATQTLSLCVPGLLSGVSTSLWFERQDVYGSRYARGAVATF